MQKSLIIATGNPGKVRELRRLLAALPVEILTPDQVGINLEVQETGTSYQENATLKALEYARRSNLVSLADDSGLEVEALGGAPGIHSARFAPQTGATDADRRAYLLEQLAAHPRPWIARFFCQVVIATPQEKLFTTTGICSGEIIPAERGTGGFGYDPIFFLPEFNQTMAELSPEIKNQISHRGRAVRAAIPILENLFKDL
jgi:XTP/dITP diphosphohydrolase